VARIVYEIRPGGGGDYTSISGFETGEQTDLVAAGDIAAGECYSGGNLQSSECNFAGWTTDAANYVELYVPPAERHAGLWATGDAYMNAGTGGWYGLNMGTTSWKIEGLQIQGGEQYAIGVNRPNVAGSLRQELVSCVVRGTQNQATVQVATTGTGPLIVRNNLIIHEGTAMGLHVREPEHGTPTYTIQNNTVVNEGSGTYGIWLGVQWVSATLVLRNNVAYGFATADMAQLDGAWSGQTATNNATLDNTQIGTSGLDLSADPFNDSGALDFSITSGSALYDAGVDLSGSFTDDIVGTTRSTWDIGAFEVAAGGPVLLVVQDSQHGHTSATVALVQQHVLVVNGSQHGHTSATVTLVQQHTLAVDGSQHGHTSQNVALVVTGWVLEPDDSQHGHTSQQVVLVLPGGVTVVLTRVGLTIGIGIGR
jgi:hypothetical protein